MSVSRPGKRSRKCKVSHRPINTQIKTPRAGFAIHCANKRKVCGTSGFERVEGYEQSELCFPPDRRRAELGLGDAKLFAAAGAWLSLEGLPSVMVWASCAALLGVLVAIHLRQPVEATTRVPFGPFLAFGFWVVWLYGPIA